MSGDMLRVKTGSWTDHSLDWIDRQERETRLHGKELEKHCRKNYPYARRQGWAYKAWLKAMRIRFRLQAVQLVRGGRMQLSQAQLERLGQRRLFP